MEQGWDEWIQPNFPQGTGNFCRFISKAWPAKAGIPLTGIVMKKIFTALLLPLTWMLTGSGLLAATQNITIAAAQTYLEVVGPPALRFQAVNPNNASFLAELTLPKAKPAPSVPMPT